MDDTSRTFTIIFGAIGLLLAMPIIGVLFGAISGYIVGLFFSESILGVLNQTGIEDVSMWQLGAFLGFVGGSFKSSKGD